MTSLTAAFSTVRLFAMITGLVVLAASVGAQTGTVAFSSSTYSVSDTDTGAIITVIYSGSTTGTATVDFRTVDGSAKTGVDFTATTGTLVFATGILQNTFNIPLSGSGLPSNETLTVVLSNPSGPATLGSPSSAVLTILSTAAAELNLSAPQYNVVRKLGIATVTVIRTGDTSNQATVHYATSDSGIASNGILYAQNGIDYFDTTGTLLFNPGESSKSFSFHVIDPLVFASNKTVKVTLTNATGAPLGTQDTAAVLLVNDKTQTITFTTNTDVVTMTLKYAGTMELSQPLPPFDILLSGTDMSSVLTVKIKKSKTGIGLISVKSIIGLTGYEGCRTIDAPGVDLTGNGVQLGGFLGTLRVHDILNGAAVIAGGDNTQATTISAHAIADATAIAIGSRISSLKAVSFGSGTIDAPSAGSISISGDKKQGVAGNFAANITLTGAGVISNQFTLGQLSVAGTISNVTIDIADGNVGSINAGQLIDSSVTIGYQPDDPSALLAGGSFSTNLTLQTVNIRAKTNGFINSFIVAARIGSVSLGSTLRDNYGTPFGILADQSIGAVSVKTPTFKWKKTGATDQSLGDFHIIH